MTQKLEKRFQMSHISICLVTPQNVITTAAKCNNFSNAKCNGYVYSSVLKQIIGRGIGLPTFPLKATEGDPEVFL